MSKKDKQYVKDAAKQLLKRLWPNLKTSDEFMNELNNKIENYIPGVHCDDKDCYACAQQRKICTRLVDLDKPLDLDKDL